jgi:hypothetical protein
MVDKLSQQLDWWLRSKLLDSRHVHIVYKD